MNTALEASGVLGTLRDLVRQSSPFTVNAFYTLIRLARAAMDPASLDAVATVLVDRFLSAHGNVDFSVTLWEIFDPADYFVTSLATQLESAARSNRDFACVVSTRPYEVIRDSSTEDRVRGNAQLLWERITP